MGSGQLAFLEFFWNLITFWESEAAGTFGQMTATSQEEKESEHNNTTRWKEKRKQPADGNKEKKDRLRRADVQNSSRRCTVHAEGISVQSSKEKSASQPSEWWNLTFTGTKDHIKTSKCSPKSPCKSLFSLCRNSHMNLCAPDCYQITGNYKTLDSSWCKIQTREHSMPPMTL